MDVLEFFVQGECRRSGQSNAIGVATATLVDSNDNGHWTRTKSLEYDYYSPTNKRAELYSIILALDWAQEKHTEYFDSEIPVIIHTDSHYAIKCLDNWVKIWHGNGWISANGDSVANSDLIKEACRLRDEIKREEGLVTFAYIPREENYYADYPCTAKLDELELNINH